MIRAIDRTTSSPGRLRGGPAALVAAMLLLGGCSGLRREKPCEVGQREPCETPCGPGLRSCDEGGWTPCTPTDAVDCLPDETGACELGPGEPPGRWACSEDCRVGPCEPACEPGAQVEAECECGPGARYCSDEGTWSECIEYVAHECRRDEVERCAEGLFRRCDGCAFGPCLEETSCTPGEVTNYGICGVMECRPDGTWPSCRPPCEVGEVELCTVHRAYCGAGLRVCTLPGQWSECMEEAALPPE
jgi:hypothetical protein